MIITPHFSREEFDCHDGTPYPTGWINNRLRVLCETLERIRARVGEPITVSSGYRTPSYNRKIGGARASQHMEGKASDIWTRSFRPLVLGSLIHELYDQGIIQIGGLGFYPTFVHVDTRDTPRLIVWNGNRTTN